MREQRRRSNFTATHRQTVRTVDSKLTPPDLGAQAPSQSKLPFDIAGLIAYIYQTGTHHS